MISLDVLNLILPALLAGMLVLVTHVPLGQVVLARGIIFIDLAIAQIAGVGVIAAETLGLEHLGLGVQGSALLAALLGAALLAWTERHWRQWQEAIIGISFVLAATAGILLLSHNPHAGEHLKDLLVGQILWVTLDSLWSVLLLYIGLLAVWFSPLRHRYSTLVFYFVFALAVTASVQLLGVFLVFASLIIPALATAHLQGRCRLLAGFLLGTLAYLLGLWFSVYLDLPAGASIVWTLVLIALIWHALLYLKKRKQEYPSEDDRDSMV